MDILEIENAIRQDIAKGSIRLPSLPDTYNEVMAIVHDDNKGIHELVSFIQSDVALCARLLQVANSPMFRTRDGLTNVRDVVQRLGVEYIKNVILCASIKDKVRSPSPILQSKMEQVWTHSLEVAVHAKVLCQYRVRKLNSELAFTCGLIHDIGRLPVLSFLSTHKLEDPELEQLLQALRCYVGVEVLKAWRFAPEFIEVIENEVQFVCHDSFPPTYSDVINLIHLFRMYSNNTISDENLLHLNKVLRKLHLDSTTALELFWAEHADELQHYLTSLDRTA